MPIQPCLYFDMNLLRQSVAGKVLRTASLPRYISHAITQKWYIVYFLVDIVSVIPLVQYNAALGENKVCDKGNLKRLMNTCLPCLPIAGVLYEALFQEGSSSDEERGVRGSLARGLIAIGAHK